MHSILNLNKFENSYQILENNSRIHKECLHKFIWCKILITNTLGIKVHKCMNVTKTKCLITMLNFFLNDHFKQIKPLIEYGPHWINVIILTFINENNRYSRSLYKIWNKIISFEMRKKREI